MMRKETTRLLMVLLSAVLIASCASGPEPASGPLPPPQPRATLLVENQSTSEMRVFVLAGGQRIRLGQAPGNRTTSLRIPDHIVAQGRERARSA
jgi:hypothetical protein